MWSLKNPAEKKPRGDAILKTLPDALQEEIWQFLRHNTQQRTLEWLRTEHGITCAAGVLTAFFDWYPQQYTLRQAASTSDQLQVALRNLPKLKVTAAQASQIAQVSFEIQAQQNRDPKLYAALRKGELERARLALEREKFEESKKQDWEKGLDALLAEIKDNPTALALFKQLKAALAEGVTA